MVCPSLSLLPHGEACISWSTQNGCNSPWKSRWQDRRLPSHILNMVLSTMHVGGVVPILAEPHAEPPQVRAERPREDTAPCPVAFPCVDMSNAPRRPVSPRVPS